MQVSKWGNSLAVRLPASLVAALELREGDRIALHAAGAREMVVARKPRRDELLARLDAHAGRLPDDFTWDRAEAVRG